MSFYDCWDEVFKWMRIYFNFPVQVFALIREMRFAFSGETSEVTTEFLSAIIYNSRISGMGRLVATRLDFRIGFLDR